MHVYTPKIDGDPLEVPPHPHKVRYAFEMIPLGGSGTFDRAVSTVRDAITEFKRTPVGQGMRFRYRPVTKHQTRVWRIK